LTNSDVTSCLAFPRCAITLHNVTSERSQPEVR
jgi:hypothetical protein